VLRLYALVRSDLGMSPGKMIAQAGHAYVGTILECLRTHPDLETAYHADGIGTKVALSIPTLDSLLWVQSQAQAAGIPCVLITDQGHMSFHGGEPTVTALGLGPCTREQCRRFTKRFEVIP
jgi:peptidyl-tRNA hydrolase